MQSSRGNDTNETKMNMNERAYTSRPAGLETNRIFYFDYVSTVQFKRTAVHKLISDPTTPSRTMTDITVSTE